MTNFREIAFPGDMAKMAFVDNLMYNGEVINAHNSGKVTIIRNQFHTYRVTYLGPNQFDWFVEEEYEVFKTNTLVLMTALVPTTGHIDLIQFADDQYGGGDVHVIISERSGEPSRGEDRIAALEVDCKRYGVQFHLHSDDNAPQNPSECANEKEFWEYWCKAVNNFVKVDTIKYLVASEKYGIELSRALDAEFIPYDIARVLNPITGTNARRMPTANRADISPTFLRKHMSIRACMFGQESVGKTTIGRLIANTNDAAFRPEYAREYLETVGAELSISKMNRIHRGQRAFQQKQTNDLLSVFDTDLFSTVGYYRIMGLVPPPELTRDAYELKCDVYFILPDDMPMVEDPLRYGGKERQSSKQFWIDLAQEFDLNYVLVPPGSEISKLCFINQYIRSMEYKMLEPFYNFERT